MLVIDAERSAVAHAKINLALHVRRRTDDGYHAIETLFAFAEHGDVLTAAPADADRFAVTGPFAPAILGDNLVETAIERFRARFGRVAPIAVTLDKRLPVAAGLGGGSADAAAMLRLLAGWRGLAPDDRDLLALAAGLGADVPACLASIPVRGEGRGDRLTPIDPAGLAGAPLLLVNPGVALATGPVFAGWDAIDRGALGTGGDPLAAACAGRNDLEPPAIVRAPVIATLLADLREQPGVRLARMSGSGATCFALFASDADRDRADRAIVERHPRWWRLATRLR